MLPAPSYGRFTGALEFRSQCCILLFMDNGGQRQGQRGTTPGTTRDNARAQEIGPPHKLLLYQRRQDPLSCACLGKYVHVIENHLKNSYPL